MAFLLFKRRRLFNSFVTSNFKKRKNRNETPFKNQTKFNGIFAFLLSKL